jgi:hypothetical protein
MALVTQDERMTKRASELGIETIDYGEFRLRVLRPEPNTQDPEAYAARALLSPNSRPTKTRLTSREHPGESR